MPISASTARIGLRFVARSMGLVIQKFSISDEQAYCLNFLNFSYRRVTMIKAILYNEANVWLPAKDPPSNVLNIFYIINNKMTQLQGGCGLTGF